MKKTNAFLVPDYYPAFFCKMGACRHTDFGRYAANLLHQAGCEDKDHLQQLICL